MAATALTGFAAEEAAPASASSGEKKEKEFSYVPVFHGAIRSRWELNTQNGDNRFQVRNARLSLEGKVASSISYFIQTDLCDQGSMKILDAWGKFGIIDGLYVQAGQFRMPFGVEPFRAPANYIFANRSFMGKQMMNYRAVGGKVGYTLPKTPLTIEAGMFNPTSIGNHAVWNRTVAYSGKLTYTLPDGFSLSAGYASIKPNDKRANLIDACLIWQNKNWLVQGEYMFEHYTKNVYDDAHSYVVFADWHKPVNCGVFNQWSIQARLDGMTDHYQLTTGKDDVHDQGRQRVTIGSTLTYKYKMVHADVRLNYEKYFAWDFGKMPGDLDRLVAEIVVRF